MLVEGGTKMDPAELRALRTPMLTPAEQAELRAWAKAALALLPAIRAAREGGSL